MTGQVSLGGLATSLALVAVAAAISLWQRLGLERQVLRAAARALVQLLLVGAALTLIIEPGRSLVWSWLWVVAMVAYAGDVQPARRAAVPYVRAALRAALLPQIETTKATGLVFLPGAMTGLILAGVPPIQAVLVQAVVMFLALASVSTTTVVVTLGLVRHVFTSDHRLRPLPRPAK